MQRDWSNIAFLAGVHLLALAGGIIYFIFRSPTLGLWLLAAVWTGCTIFALSAGYHRLFSHRSYEAHTALRFFLLIFGAASFQNSAITWAADHRRHHKNTDSEDDPYNALRGFWWSHVGWVLHKTPPAASLYPVPDLEESRLVSWQHRRYPLIGLVVGFLIPTLIGWALGDAWGGLVLAGFLRLIFVYHVTFSVNSLAHLFGRQPYSTRNTARDSLIVALVTMGEGYHNFHHTFPGDYRNGVRAHHFDPSKWGIWLLATVGLARSLRRTPWPAIARAREPSRV